MRAFEDLHPKFIIENKSGINKLILGKCIFHNELADDIFNVRGGGLFEFNFENNRFKLYDTSFEFGSTKLEDVRNCILNNDVYSNKRCSISIAERYSFLFVDENKTEHLIK